MTKQEKECLTKWLKEKRAKLLRQHEERGTLKHNTSGEDIPKPEIGKVDQTDLTIHKITKALSWIETPRGGFCYLYRTELSLSHLTENYNTRLCKPCSSILKGKDQ